MKKLRMNAAWLLIFTLIAVNSVFGLQTGIPEVSAAGGEPDFSLIYNESNYEQEFAPGRVIIGLTNSIPQTQIQTMDSLSEYDSIFDGIEVENVDVLLSSIGNENAYLRSGAANNAESIIVADLVGKEKDDVINAIDILKNNSAVAYAEPDYIVTASTVWPNDEYFNDQYGMDRINTPSAWENSTGDGSVVVGIIDSGIDFNHEDLRSNIWVNPGESPYDLVDNDNNGYIDDSYGYNFYHFGSSDSWDDNGHGTHVAGIIGASGDNEIGVAGVNWNVKLASLKFLDRFGYGSNSDAIEAINYAQEKKMPIINCSWGGEAYSQSLYDAMYNYNGLIVAAAGNDGKNNDEVPDYPSCYNLDNLISVANFDESFVLDASSNYGASTVHIAAPGTRIVSTFPNNQYASLTGTSMAAPHVAGAAALLLQYNPDIKPAELKNKILENTYYNSNLTGKVSTGGEIEVSRLLYNNLKEGVIGSVTSTDSWYTSTFTTEEYDVGDGYEYPFAQFTVDRLGVRCNGRYYGVPKKSFSYRDVWGIYDYEKNSNYMLCAKVYYDNRAEFCLDLGGTGDDIQYYDDFALIPIARVHSDNKGQLFVSRDGISPESELFYWGEYTQDNKLANFEIEEIDVRIGSSKYTVPNGYFQYSPEDEYYDYEASKYYELCVKADYDTRTAEYILDTGERQKQAGYGSNDIAYFPNYALIPIVKLASDRNGMLTEDFHTGIINPGKDEWWTSKRTTITWMPETEYPVEVPYSSFKLEAINVECLDKVYTVPEKFFDRDWIYGGYDYEPYRTYGIGIKVNYDGAAEYKIFPSNWLEEISNGEGIVHYSDYAIIPLLNVYTDDWQMHVESVLY